MKFLDIVPLANITNLLTEVESGDAVINGRVECYSCKKVTSDRKLAHSLERQYSEIAKSPEQGAVAVSPFGPLTDKNSRATLIDLISTLNLCYPDYDFSNVKAEQFHKESSFNVVANTVNTVMSPAIAEWDKIRTQLWQAIDVEVQINDCEIFSFIADPDSDPFEEEGNLWSFNYLFYNKKKLKRMLLFTCRAQRTISRSDHGTANRSSLAYEDEDAYGSYVYENMDVEI